MFKIFKRNEFNEVIVTNKIIRAGHETYPINNLVRIGMYTVSFSFKEKIILTILAYFISLFIFSSIDKDIGIKIILFNTISTFIITLFYKKYALHLETNSGSSNLFTSSKEKFILELIECIQDVMQTPDQPRNYIANINKNTIYNNIDNKKIKNINTGIIGDNNIAGDNNQIGDNNRNTTNANIRKNKRRSV